MGMAKLAPPQEKPGAFWRDWSPSGTALRTHRAGWTQFPAPQGRAAALPAPNRGWGPFHPPTRTLKDNQWSPSPIPLRSLPLPTQLCPLTLPEPSSTSSSASSSLPSWPAQGTVTAHSDCPLAPGLALLAPGTVWSWVRARGRLQLKLGQCPRACDTSVGGQ